MDSPKSEYPSLVLREKFSSYGCWTSPLFFQNNLNIINLWNRGVSFFSKGWAPESWRLSLWFRRLCKHRPNLNSCISPVKYSFVIFLVWLSGVAAVCSHQILEWKTSKHPTSKIPSLHTLPQPLLQAEVSGHTFPTQEINPAFLFALWGVCDHPEG